MGIGGSVAAIALGAILAFAVEVESTQGFNINTIGVILMIAGAIGLVATLAIWGPRRGDRDVVVERRDVV